MNNTLYLYEPKISPERDIHASALIISAASETESLTLLRKYLKDHDTHLTEESSIRETLNWRGRIINSMNTNDDELPTGVIDSTQSEYKHIVSNCEQQLLLSYFRFKEGGYCG